MARHRTRVGAVYVCALSRSPTTEDSENFERKSEDGAARERCIHRVYACTWYVRMSRVDHEHSLRRRPTRDVELTVSAAFVAAAISNILPGSFFF